MLPLHLPGARQVHSSCIATSSRSLEELTSFYLASCDRQIPFFFAELEPRTLGRLDKCSTTEIQIQPLYFILLFYFLDRVC